MLVNEYMTYELTTHSIIILEPIEKWWKKKKDKGEQKR